MELLLGIDPWVKSLALLQSDFRYSLQHAVDPALIHPLSSVKKRRKRKLKSERDVEHARQTNARIQILERLTSLTISLSWRDSTCSNYAEQTWRLGVARWSGRCALTGEHIVLGQPVYKPTRSGRLRPANYDEMILESAVIKATAENSNSKNGIRT